jgi:hypothetical protein
VNVQRECGKEVAMRRMFLGVGIVLGLLGSTGCVVAVQERRPPPPYGYCANWVWIPGHYGPMGRWHPGHWRCG